MGKRVVLLVLLVAGASFAGDIILRNSGTKVAPVSELDCVADGGLGCTRLGARGLLACSPATWNQRGCVTTPIRYGTCPERQLLWTVPPARYDGGTVIGQLETLDPAGGRIDYLTLIDSGGAKATDGGTTQASFLLVIQ